MAKNEDRYSPTRIREALELENFDSDGAWQKLTPRSRGLRPPEMSGRPRRSSVLLILYRKNGITQLVLTRRQDDLNSHAGQISFPGGRREVGESLQSTALREAHEEIGLDLDQLEIIGRLSCHYIPPSGYQVYPFVSWYAGPQRFRRQESEVAEIVEVSLTHLLDPENQYEETWDIRGFQVQVPYYLVASHKVWGATAMILSEFLERIKNGDQGEGIGDRRSGTALDMGDELDLYEGA